jgi:prepilin-type N-terminal cleavage/methylation domain-containing protein
MIIAPDRHPTRAFTLVELLATIAVLGLSVAGAMPILSSVRDSAHRATTVSHQHHEAALAIQRIAELLRPSGNPNDPALALSRMTPNEFRLTTGEGVALVRGALVERDTRGRTHPLARAIDRFELRYLRDDGTTAALSPTDVHAVEIRIDTTDTSCATRVFLRGRMAIP